MKYAKSFYQTKEPNVNPDGNKMRFFTFKNGLAKFCIQKIYAQTIIIIIDAFIRSFVRSFVGFVWVFRFGKKFFC